MSNPQNSKKVVRTLSRTVDNAVLLALLVILLIACYALWDAHQLYAAADTERYTEYKPTADNALSFEELRALNSDVIGWLTVYDTRIDYPVLRSPKTNDDYLSKNALGEWEGSGSLFLDHNNRADFSDFNTIIYGHHMTERKMFGDIDLFLKKDFFDKHEYANLYYSETGLELVQDNASNPNMSPVAGLHYEFVNYQGQNHGIQFFAMLQAETSDQYIYYVPSQTEEAKLQTLQSIADRALLVRNLQTGETRQIGTPGAKGATKTGTVDASFFGISTSDRIVLMSTCSADITNGRFVLVGKLLENEVANPFPEEETSEPQYRDDLFSALDKVMDLPIWLWIIILIVAIILIGLLYKAERERLRRKKKKKYQRETEEREQNDP